MQQNSVPVVLGTLPWYILGCVFSEVVNVFDDIDYRYLTSREVFFFKKNVEKNKDVGNFFNEGLITYIFSLFKSNNNTRGC